MTESARRIIARSGPLVVLLSLVGCTAELHVPCLSFSLECRAPYVIGQPDFFTSVQRRSGVYRPNAARAYQGKFFVADGSNARVLIWNTVPFSPLIPPDVVVGHTDAYDSNNVQPSWSGVYGNRMGAPHDIAFAGTKMIVSDPDNNRVLIWNQIPTTNYAMADVVLGQPDFASNAANNGGVSAQSLNTPRGLYSDGTRLWVADYNNNRVLVWNTIPTVNQTAATGVIGQSSMTTNTANSPSMSLSTFSGPTAVYGDGARFFVADRNNNRVLIWNSIPTSATSASWVVGQSTANAGSCNPSGVAANSLCFPGGVFSSGSALLVTDTNNSRIMIWNSIPASNGTSANAVLGQPDFFSNSPNNMPDSAYQLSSPVGVSGDGNRLYVADTLSSRILFWSSVPSTSQRPAELELEIKPTSTLLGRTTSVDSDGTRMVITDTMNHRVLLWNQIPTSNTIPPDVVLGQVDFTTRLGNAGTGSGGVSGSTMGFPTDAKIVGNKLFVADSGNNRVLFWNQIPTTNAQAADGVLGQASLSTKANGTSANSLSFPISVAANSTELWVSDNANNRVLIWSLASVTTGAAAQKVLGQSGLNSGSANAGGLSGSTLRSPRGIFLDDEYGWVADTGNHRVLRFTAGPATGQGAGVVVGQPDMFTSTEYTGGMTAKSLSAPQSVFVVNGELYIANRERFEIWTKLPEKNFAPADLIFGQAGDFQSAYVNRGGLSMNSLSGVQYRFWSDGNRIFLPDGQNHRVISFLRHMLE